MTKVSITPDTTLFPVPVVLVTCGVGQDANVFSLNRIASCNAEPPMISISVRPQRASHDLIDQWGEFVINIPWQDMGVISDFVGTTTVRKLDKWQATGLTPLPAHVVQVPLLAECPINLECQVRQVLRLPSHSLFVAEVVAIHAEVSVLNEHQEVNFDMERVGLVYHSGVVRERPVDKFRPDQLRREVDSWKERPSAG